MKKILNFISMFAISFLMVSAYSFAQNNQQNQRNHKNMKNENTAQSDTNYANSMAYYKYAEKNIITDKSKDESYKGKFHDQNNTGESSSNENMKSSNNQMMSSNNMMMDSTKHKMGKKKSMWDTTKSKTHKSWKKKSNKMRDTTKSKGY